MKIDVIVPAKDEEETLDLVLKDLFEVIGELEEDEYEFSVFVVNDHSEDKTVEIAESFSDVTLLKNERPPGKGNTLVKGFEETDGDVIVMLDADYSHRPEDLKKFLEKIEEGAGLVIGSRVMGGSDEYDLLRGFGNRMLTQAFNLLFGRSITDVLNGYKCFRRDLIENRDFKAEGFDIEIEIVTEAIKRGYRIEEVPAHERKRAGGEMKSTAYVEGPLFLLRTIFEFFKIKLGVK